MAIAKMVPSRYAKEPFRDNYTTSLFKALEIDVVRWMTCNSLSKIRLRVVSWGDFENRILSQMVVENQTWYNG